MVSTYLVLDIRRLCYFLGLWIFIRGGSATIQKRKGRGHRAQEGTEGIGSATIQKRKGRGHRVQEVTEGGGSAIIQRRKGRGQTQRFQQRVEEKGTEEGRREEERGGGGEES